MEAERGADMAASRQPGNRSHEFLIAVAARERVGSGQEKLRPEEHFTFPWRQEPEVAHAGL
jgi:hypothetical protein